MPPCQEEVPGGCLSQTGTPLTEFRPIAGNLPARSSSRSQLPAITLSRPMLARFGKLLLVCTAFAPVLLTIAVTRWVRGDIWPGAASYVAVTLGLFILCVGVLKAAGTMLERLSFQPSEVKTADTEIVGFVLTYLLPLVNANTDHVEWRILGFVLLLLFLVVWSTNSYHFNPLLAFLGYHFYEVTDSSRVSYVLVTRRSLKDTSAVQRVVQLSEYMLLDVEDVTNG